MNNIKKAFKFVWKYCRAWLITSLAVLIFVFTVTMVLTQNDFLAGTLDTVFGGEGRKVASGDPNKYVQYPKDTDKFTQFDPGDLKLSSDVISSGSDKKAVLAAANKLNEEIVGEGIVLLKNETIADGRKALPIATSAGNKARISVFGKNSANIVLGGSGSGGSGTDDAVSLYTGLRNANFELNPKLVSFYEGKASGKGRSANPAIGAKVTGLDIGETPQASYSQDIKDSYANYSDAALVVFSRIGGEGFDLPRMQITDYGKGPVSGSKPGGQHYLELDSNEEALLEAVTSNPAFKRVIVVINCATPMELGFIKSNDKITGALWLGFPGNSGANAFGRVLSGEITPSGHLVDTYISDFTADPTWQNFGDNLANNGNTYLAGGSATEYHYVEYEEGIYLGYRYYETRSFQDYYKFGTDYGWYDENVVYPFGYGMSYASFEWTLTSATSSATPLDADTNNKITVSMHVKNTSTEYSGKDVIQLYYSAPYINNGVEKAHVVLGGVVKTGLLAPRGEGDYTLELDIKDMASYDYSDANGNGFRGYELDAGLYTIYIGRNAHDCWSDNGFKLEYSLIDGIQYPMDIYGDHASSNNRFDDMSDYMNGKVMSRSNIAATFPTAPTRADREMTETVRNSLNFTYDDTNADYVARFTNEVRMQGKAGAAKKLYDMIDATYDSAEWEKLIDYLTLDEMIQLIGQGNFHTISIESISKPITVDPDGPAGFTNFMGDPTVHDTCFYCSECVIGATWNADLAHDMGIMVGLESLVGYTKGDGRTYSGWYAPAVNIHRSPFSGRNWEYYSEDPFLTGMLGSNVVIGAQTMGVYTYVKHFVLNDQETHRDANGLVTWADEQTFREIYLKPFQIIVEKGKTRAIMSSFNRIGGVWAGGSYPLLTEVLRMEWGFEGMVITDYDLSVAYMHPDQAIRAGNDLILSQDYKPSSGASRAGMSDELQLKALRKATKNILYTISKSNAMNGYGPDVVWKTTMATWKVLAIWINIALLLLAALWGFLAIHFKRKNLKTDPEYYDKLKAAKREKKAQRKAAKSGSVNADSTPAGSDEPAKESDPAVGETPEAAPAEEPEAPAEESEAPAEEPEAPAEDAE